MQGAARAIIDSIEAMAPSTLHVEHDEQGRPRVIRLEMTPRMRELVADAAVVDGGSIEGAVQRRADRTAALERCLDVIREGLSVREDVARESVTDRIALEGGALSSVRAAARAHDRECRANKAWERIQDALRDLSGDAS